MLFGWLRRRGGWEREGIWGDGCLSKDLEKLSR